jgi:hypothetical protein
MPKRTNKPFHYKQNRRRRQNRNNTSYNSTLTRTLTTAASTYSSPSSFTFQQLTPDLQSTASPRFVTLRRVALEFSATNTLITGVSEQVGIQVNVIDQTTGHAIPMNSRLLILSETNPRRMSIRVPSKFAHPQSSQSTNVAFELIIVNMDVAAVTAFDVRLTPTFTLAPILPVPV